MRDKKLRSGLIKLAHENPELRDFLVPVIASSNKEAMAEILLASSIAKDLLEFVNVAISPRAVEEILAGLIVSFKVLYRMAEINPDSLIKIREELYKKLPEFMKKLGSVQKIGSRPIREIAKEIKSLWHPVNYAAQPYLDSMLEMDNADDTVGADDGHGIILYFLNNASGFKGADAKRIKAELKSLLK